MNRVSYKNYFITVAHQSGMLEAIDTRSLPPIHFIHFPNWCASFKFNPIELWHPKSWGSPAFSWFERGGGNDLSCMKYWLFIFFFLWLRHNNPSIREERVSVRSVTVSDKTLYYLQHRGVNFTGQVLVWLQFKERIDAFVYMQARLNTVCLQERPTCFGSHGCIFNIESCFTCALYSAG